MWIYSYIQLEVLKIIITDLKRPFGLKGLKLRKSSAALIPHEISLIIISVRIGSVGGMFNTKIPVTPSGIEPATFRILAQCLSLPRPRIFGGQNLYWVRFVFWYRWFSLVGFIPMLHINSYVIHVLTIGPFGSPVPQKDSVTPHQK